MCILKVPQEVLQVIFAYLTQKEKLEVSLTCKSMHDSGIPLIYRHVELESDRHAHVFINCMSKKNAPNMRLIIFCDGMIVNEDTLKQLLEKFQKIIESCPDPKITKLDICSSSPKFNKTLKSLKENNSQVTWPIVNIDIAGIPGVGVTDADHVVLHMNGPSENFSEKSLLKKTATITLSPGIFNVLTFDLLEFILNSFKNVELDGGFAWRLGRHSLENVQASALEQVKLTLYVTNEIVDLDFVLDYLAKKLSKATLLHINISVHENARFIPDIIEAAQDRFSIFLSKMNMKKLIISCGQAFVTDNIISALKGKKLEHLSVNCWKSREGTVGQMQVLPSALEHVSDTLTLLSIRIDTIISRYHNEHFSTFIASLKHLRILHVDTKKNFALVGEPLVEGWDYLPFEDILINHPCLEEFTAYGCGISFDVRKLLEINVPFSKKLRTLRLVSGSTTYNCSSFLEDFCPSLRNLHISGNVFYSGKRPWNIILNICLNNHILDNLDIGPLYYYDIETKNYMNVSYATVSQHHKKSQVYEMQPTKDYEEAMLTAVKVQDEDYDKSYDGKYSVNIVVKALGTLRLEFRHPTDLPADLVHQLLRSYNGDPTGFRSPALYRRNH